MAGLNLEIECKDVGLNPRTISRTSSVETGLYLTDELLKSTHCKIQTDVHTPCWSVVRPEMLRSFDSIGYRQ
jgi:hypothetical protein